MHELPAGASESWRARTRLVLPWAVLGALCGLGFLVGYVITGDQRDDEPDDWLLAVVAGAALIGLVAATLVMHRRNRRP